MTKILEKLTSRIELELEEKLHSFSRTVLETTGSVDRFATQIDQLGLELGDLMAQMRHSATVSYLRFIFLTVIDEWIGDLYR